MRRLCWKELREQGLWFLLWLLALVTLAALGKADRYCWMDIGDTPWLLIPLALALLAGLLGYKSELAGGRASFLYSRAQLWKSLLFVKIITGIIVTLLAVGLSVLASRLCAPAAYRPFLTPAYLAASAIYMSAATGGAYLLGLCCSIVLPGLAGSIITLLFWLGMGLIIGNIQEMLAPHANDYISSIGIFCAPFIALVVLARFGLTLSWKERAVRYVLVMEIVMIGCLVVNQLPPTQRVITRIFPPSPRSASSLMSTIYFSPQGKYVIISRNDIRLWVNLATGQRVLLPQNASFEKWLDDDCMICSVAGDKPEKSYSALACVDQGQIRLTPLAGDMRTYTFRGRMQGAIPSPDGRYVILPSIDGKAARERLSVVNPHTGARQELLNLPYDFSQHRSQQAELSSHYWWQDNQTVGYYDYLTNRRLLLKVKHE
jgi:hypothetical protein